MAFFSIAALRPVLTTESDADSPGSEELIGQLRENWEALTMLAFDTGVSGTVVSVSGATLTDTGNFAGADVHNGHTLVITSGDAIGYTYTIDDTTVDTLVCTGDNLETDGVAASDTYKVFYDLKVNDDGHSHDGINSANIDVPQTVTFQITDNDYGPTTGAENEDFHYHYFYKQSYHDTLYWQCQMYSSGTHSITLTVHFGTTTDTGNTSAGAYTIVNGSVDISGESDGWLLFYLNIATSETDTAHVRRFAAYVD